MIIKDLRKALLQSLQGIKQTWNQEKAFRREVVLCLLVLPFVFWSKGETSDKFFVIFALGLMFITELLNTAIEKANDAYKKTDDPLIKFSKDAASASVFVALCLVGISVANLGWLSLNFKNTSPLVGEVKE